MRIRASISGWPTSRNWEVKSRSPINLRPRPDQVQGDEERSHQENPKNDREDEQCLNR